MDKYNQCTNIKQVKLTADNSYWPMMPAQGLPALFQELENCLPMFPVAWCVYICSQHPNDVLASATTNLTVGEETKVSIQK